MSTKSRWVILDGGLCAYLVGLGFLGGIAAERVRFDHRRTALLNRYDESVRQWHGHLMQFEHATRGPRDATEAPWAAHIRRVNEALAWRNVSDAERAWGDAYRVVMGSKRWDGMVEVGDAYLRIGEVAGTRKASEAKARSLYLAALFRARQQSSLDGVLRAAEAFASFGDREVVEQSLRIAELLAAQDPEARADVRAFRKRWPPEDPSERGNPVQEAGR